MVIRSAVHEITSIYNQSKHSTAQCGAAAFNRMWRNMHIISHGGAWIWLGKTALLPAVQNDDQQQSLVRP